MPAAQVAAKRDIGFVSSRDGVQLATARYGAGKVAAVGDSSPADDGTGQSGNTLYVGWDDPLATNDVVLLNMCLWLAASSNGSRNSFCAASTAGCTRAISTSS